MNRFKKSSAWPVSLKLIIKNYWGIGLTVMSGLAWLAPKFREPYVIDEAAFPYAASAVAHTGMPVYYNGELALHNVATWHPPLYVYSLGAFMRLFGDSQIAVRTFSLICFFLTSFLIYKIILTLNPNHEFAANVGLLFYSLNYFILASALIPDIDGTLLPLVIGFFVYVFSKDFTTEQNRSKMFNFWEIIALSICFSTKLTTTLLLLPFIFIATYTRNRKVLQSLLRTVISSSLAIAVFLAWWIPVAIASNLEWQMPFQFTFQSLTHKSNHPSILDIFKSMFTFSQPVISWVGPLSFIVFVILSWRALMAQDKKTRNYMLCILGAAISIVLLYNTITAAPFTFPKYWNTSFIFLAVALGTLWPKIRINFKFTHAIPWIAVAISGWLLDFMALNSQLKKSKSMASFGLSSLLVSLFIFSVFLAVVLFQRSSIKLHPKYFILPAIIFTTLLHSTAVSSAIENQKFSTRYFFGESGESEAIDWIKSNIRHGDKIMSAKDIGLQSHQVFYEDAVVFASHNALTINKYLLDENVKWIVVRNLYDWSAIVYPEIFNALSKDYSPIKAGNLGDFQIWRRNK